MDANYVFLCGLMWYRGQEDAGCELVRAIKSADPDLKALAWAMLWRGSEAAIQTPRSSADLS